MKERGEIIEKMTTISPTDSSQGDLAAVTPTTDDGCLNTKEIETSHEVGGRDTAIKSTEDPTEIPPCTTENESQQTEDAAVSKTILPKKPAWGLPQISSNTPKNPSASAKEGSKSAPSFAEIMNDQSSDRAAARLAYSDDAADKSVSLSEIQAEQERILASLTLKGQDQSPSTSIPHDNTSDIDLNLTGIDEEERKMIELAMKQSLEDSNNANRKDDTGISIVSNDSASTGVATIPTTKASEDEAERQMIEAAIREADDMERQNADSAEMDAKPAAKACKSSPEDIEKEMIEAAIRAADAKEIADAEAESLKLVMQLQQEEVASARKRQQHQQRTALSTGNVRTMTRAELEAETYGDKNSILKYDDGEYDHESETGFRMNQQNQDQIGGWYRRDRNTIVGPDNEIRTKHDVHLQGQTNASFLDLDVIDDDTGLRAHVGNKAFNDFRKTVAGTHHAKGGHRGTTKGVATYGTGRAGSDANATKGGALDQNARLYISKAINAGIIERCNGVVKQGKEAAVYHAVGGPNNTQIASIDINKNKDEGSPTNDCTNGDEKKQNAKFTVGGNDGFDVAIKVFKRIKEFRGRGEYVDGDPRYAGRPFRSLTDREQLEMWTEKEFRNLVRAYRAEVPVPNPIRYKDNIIFMRFLGQDGWPAPQIREINIRKGSSKWTALYDQVMASVKKLFRDARLVHGDLSEYNILIASTLQVDHKSKNIGSEDDLQTVLIDFGQAVEVRHPKAKELLERDLARIQEFFSKQDVKTTMPLEEALKFVIGDYSFSIHMNDSKMPAT